MLKAAVHVRALPFLIFLKGGISVYASVFDHSQGCTG